MTARSPPRLSDRQRPFGRAYRTACQRGALSLLKGVRMALRDANRGISPIGGLRNSSGLQTKCYCVRDAYPGCYNGLPPNSEYRCRSSGRVISRFAVRGGQLWFLKRKVIAAALKLKSVSRSRSPRTYSRLPGLPFGENYLIEAIFGFLHFVKIAGGLVCWPQFIDSIGCGGRI